MNRTPSLALPLLLAALLALAATCPTNCNDCDPSGDVCFACKEGFELSVTGQCFDASTVARCTLYGPTKQCFLCQPTYSIDNGACLKNGSPCLATDPSDDTKCTQCGFGTLLQNGVCVGTINCKSAQQNCSACAEGFTLNSSKCRDTSGNCQTVGNDGICVKCKTNFTLNGYRCVATNIKLFGCYIWNQESKCLVCKGGYNIYQGNCLLPSQIQQVLQGTVTLEQITSQRKLTITTTTTTTTTVATNANANSNSNLGFGNNGFGSFGGGNSDFGSFGGDFGSNSGFGASSNTNNVPVANCDVPDAFNPGKCLTCSYGYYVTNGICDKISIFCQAYNLITGQCLNCKFNLQLNNGKCLDANCQEQNQNGCVRCKTGFTLNSSAVCVFSDPNCLKVDGNRCGQCSTGYFITFEGSCRVLPVNCAAANLQTYACIRCKDGFQLNNNAVCVAKTITQVVTTLPANCVSADPVRPSYCLVCSNGFISNLGVCELQPTVVIPPNCQNFNQATGQCNTCKVGFTLSFGRCVASNGNSVPPANNNSSNNASRDPNCLNYSNNVCTACSNRYYFGANNQCVPINPLCKDYLPSGICTSCYPGYDVSAGNCVLAGKNEDPFCKSFNSNKICTGCYAGYFYNQGTGRCQPFNPLCKTSNPADGSCTSCFPGYTLTSDNKCQIAFQDPNCQKFDTAVQGRCLSCSARFFLGSDGKCKQVNPLCKTADPGNGACLSCYPGYVPSGGQCVLGGNSTMDVNCQKYDNGICVKCSTGYYLPMGAVNCVQFNPLCKTSNLINGACTDCYPGYTLALGSCVLSNGNAGNGDPNCKGVDGSGRCTGCYDSFYLSVQSTCIRLDPLCKGYTPAKSQCSDCYQGYKLYSGKCVIPSQVPSANSDTYCIKSEGSLCLQCSNGYFLDATKKCQQLNPLCKQSDMTTGYCTDCYQGYQLSATTCIVAAAVNIPYCAANVGSVCTSCISGYYVKNGACALANVLCASYDPNTGACFSCINGYFFQRGQCIMPSLGIDPYCIEYSNSYCTTCVSGYALVNYVCTAVDINCTDFDAVRNTCKACRNGRTPDGPRCI